jgi:hypothetical protein
MDGASAEMPRYQSHKEVWALKIAAIEFAPVDKGYATLKTDSGYRTKFQGDETDLGYYVVYKDGYKSWSPSKAFEEGYTRI